MPCSLDNMGGRWAWLDFIPLGSCCCIKNARLRLKNNTTKKKKKKNTTTTTKKLRLPWQRRKGGGAGGSIVAMAEINATALHASACIAHPPREPSLAYAKCIFRTTRRATIATSNVAMLLLLLIQLLLPLDFVRAAAGAPHFKGLSWVHGPWHG